jgi:hypothetical protein
MRELERRHRDRRTDAVENPLRARLVPLDQLAGDEPIRAWKNIARTQGSPGRRHQTPLAAELGPATPACVALFERENRQDVGVQLVERRDRGEKSNMFAIDRDVETRRGTDDSHGAARYQSPTTTGRSAPSSTRPPEWDWNTSRAPGAEAMLD